MKMVGERNYIFGKNIYRWATCATSAIFSVLKTNQLELSIKQRKYGAILLILKKGMIFPLLL